MGCMNKLEQYRSLLVNFKCNTIDQTSFVLRKDAFNITYNNPSYYQIRDIHFLLFYEIKDHA